jgi:opacity protein-like surface antigen
MKKPILGVAILLAVACAARAQEGDTSSLASSFGNAAAPFSETSAAQAKLFETDGAASDSGTFATPAAAAVPAALPAAPKPKPPKFVFGDRDDYRWQLYVGVEFYRFLSNIYIASLVGTNTTLDYYTNSWFAVEGSVVTGFAPPVVDNEHVKYFGGSGGIRIGGRRNQFEPWAHGLVGGSHLQPQTAGHSKNALSAQAGIGLDYRLNSRLSLRAELDWVYTAFFGQSQNNFQGTTGAVFHF